MPSYYGQSWDHYVAEVFDKMKREDSVFPGDEWGTPAWWDICYKRLLERAGAPDWKHVVEIGPGSGKYTALLLERSACSILAFDVSAEFIKIMEGRLAEYFAGKRLQTSLMSCDRADEMLSKIEETGMRGKVDAFVSIDAMVHVDLQYLTAYFTTAAICLRPGGKLVMTLADATSAKGREKLLRDIRLYFPMQGSMSLKFEFLSPDIVRSTLDALGFSIDLLEHDSPESETARDMFLIAEKTGSVPDALEKFLR
jgi:SAM-dependent methyltransferase